MVFVAQEFGTDIGQRNVVLRVVRDFPHVSGGGGVKDQRVAEITADPPGRGFDPAPRGGHLRIVSHRRPTGPWRVHRVTPARAARPGGRFIATPFRRSSVACRAPYRSTATTFGTRLRSTGCPSRRL